MEDGNVHSALNGILKLNAYTRTNGRVASHRTATAYGEVLHMAFDNLADLGYKIQNPHNLSDAHIAALCRHWYATGKKPSTIREYLSKLRVFAGWIGKNNMVKSLPVYLPDVDPKLLKVTKIAVESKSWSEHGIDVGLCCTNKLKA